MGREEGRTALALIVEMDKVAGALKGSTDPAAKAIGNGLAGSVQRLREATEWIVRNYAANPAAVAAGSVYYLKLTGITCGGWMLARAAQVAAGQLEKGEGEAEFLKGKILTARFYADHILAQAAGLASAVTQGADSVLSVEEAML